MGTPVLHINTGCGLTDDVDDDDNDDKDDGDNEDDGDDDDDGHGIRWPQ